jgi:eukaryotic-like serine/threonine-protein kinase
MILDVERFSDPSRTNIDQLAVRDGLYEALIHAFEDSEISWSNCMTEDRGDGALILVPPEVPKSLLVSRVPAALVDAVTTYNESRPIQTRMRLRIALHAGEVHRDAHGFASNAINHAFRLVEAPALKSALGNSPGVLALIVSEWFYDEVVRHAPESNPFSYRQVDVNVKETQTVAWIRLPDVRAAKAASAGALAEATRTLPRDNATAGNKWQEQRRAIMLRRVRYKWIEGILEPSLARAAQLVLGLERRPDLLDLGRLTVRRPGQPLKQLPEGASVGDVFNRVGGGLLIVGAPGAGKTTALLQLCDELLNRAEQDSRQAIPVVFNLASWSRDRTPLGTWLIEELSRAYQVPRRIAAEWIEEDALTLLLDGLDEVSDSYRDACANAINDWRDSHGFVALVVCSRTAELQALSSRFRLEEAVELQPPTDDELDRYLGYLEATGTPLADVRTAFASDSELRKLLHSPLLLHVIALAYHGRPAVALYESGTAAQRQAWLWDAYIARMFEQRPLIDYRYTHDKAVIWLAQLARILHDRDQTEFHLDRLAPEWLPAPAEQQRVRLLTSFIGGLAAGLVGGLTFALIGQAYKWSFGVLASVSAGLFGGLACGLLGAMVIGLSGGLTVSIQSGERVSWSWSKLQAEFNSILSRKSSLQTLPDQPRAPNAQAAVVFGLSAASIAGIVAAQMADQTLGIFAACAAGLGCSISWGLVGAMAGGVFLNIEPVEQIRWSWRKLRTGIFTTLTGGVIGGLIFGLAGVMLGGMPSARAAAPGSGLTLTLTGLLIAGLSAALRDERVVPNEGIRRSTRYAIVVGLPVGLSAGLIFGFFAELVYGAVSGLYAGLGVGLAFAVASALMFGGAACVQHYVVRTWLVRRSIAPWHYGSFLEAMAQRLLLRRSGSAYLFIHRLLRDHLADIELDQLDHKHSDSSSVIEPILGSTDDS